MRVADGVPTVRILLLGPYPLPGRPMAGGVMAVVYALAHGLRARGLQVAVASAGPHLEDARLEEQGLAIYRVHTPPLPRMRRHWWVRRKLQRVIHQFQPQIVHAHGTGLYAAVALDSARAAVITAHGVAYEEARRSQARSFKERLAWRYDARLEARNLARARYAIAINPYIRQAFAAYPAIHWFHIPNPVDERYFHIQPRPQPGRLLVPARVIPRKGTDVLIQAFIAVADAFPHAQLRIAGEITSVPEFVQKCRKLIADAHLTHRIHFLGSLDSEAMVDEYSRAAGMVLASRQETAPVVIGEALAAGCPVIATRVGGIPWMIEQGRTGLLVPPEDPQALAQALARFLADEEAVRGWRAQTRAAAQAYRLDTVLNATLQVYEALFRK